MFRKTTELYQMNVKLRDGQTGEVLDIYSQPYGIRKLDWDSDGLKINNQPFYIHGIARHEDSVTRGKGLDLPTLVRDHRLLDWLGANGYRTRH